MAKRKRLTPARAFTSPETEPVTPGPDPRATPSPSGFARTTPPIAHVAGAASSEAALARLSDELRDARDSGRMVQALPLEVIDRDYLVRDRITADEAEMQVLIDSLRARGQQTPIEVVALDDGRYGLISGWRRLEALSRLHAETGEDRFATVQALLRRPEAASDAYCAMVEENEIRVGLSYYERARIVARAAEEGVFNSPESALSSLFSSASRPKRSKIGSFVRLYAALDDQLRFASAIPERLGLALIKAIEQNDTVLKDIRLRLAYYKPADAAAEVTLLNDALTRAAQPPRPTREGAAELSLPRRPLPAGITLEAREGRVVIKGKGVSETLARDLADWLAARAE
ncbi:ParB/RepB/Spo0J family partition protein [Pseudooceanicola onchidii]|uniref:ParB/RepB/Spo0J family partition protein n=1 Tax=Pseudooceanicola onchidii TaxID=2562279 RepID=UPI0010AB44AF|nr:ParB N-terminal domain-containing protein [Pseudooceanicola onchidii]